MKPTEAEIKDFLLRMARFREDARHAIKKGPENVLVQRLQEGANLGYEAAELWSRLEYGEAPTVGSIRMEDCKPVPPEERWPKEYRQ